MSKISDDSMVFPLAEGEAQFGTVISVPVAVIWDLLRKIDNVPSWAGDVVECCLVENNMDPTTVGCKRRLVVKGGPMAGMVVRETLVAHQASAYKKFISLKLTDSEGEIAQRMQAAESSNPLEGNSFTVSEAPSPFPTRVHELITTLSVSPVSTDVNKCYVEMYCTFKVPTDNLVPPEVEERMAGDLAEVVRRCGIQECNALQRFLLDTWIRPIVVSLSDAALVVNYPVQTGFNVEFRKEYEQYDNFFAELSVQPKIDPAIAENVGKMLESWTLLTRDVFALRGVVSSLENELEAARHIQNAANSMVAASSVVKAEYNATSPAKTSSSSAAAATDAIPPQPPAMQQQGPPPRIPRPPSSSVSTQARVSSAQVREAAVGAEVATVATQVAQTTTGPTTQELQDAQSVVAPYRKRLTHDATTDTRSGPYKDVSRVFDPEIITRALHKTAALTHRPSKGSGVDSADAKTVAWVSQGSLRDAEYLQGLFNILDVEGRGFFTTSQFAQLWAKANHCSLSLDTDLGTPRKDRKLNTVEKDPELQRWLKKYGKKSKHPLLTDGDLVVDVDGFSLFLLQAAKS